LIAPESVVFYGVDWVELGNKRQLSNSLAKITQIPEEILLRPHWIQSTSIAKRMSWAAHRETTRVEDMAYSLMGIFGVNMPLLYGEGKSAFIRLQEAIMKDSEDLSLLAWGSNTGTRKVEEH
jgi:hypothetical protein